MFFEWWLIFLLFGLWIFSLLEHGSLCYRRGVYSGGEQTLSILHSSGYIRILQDGRVIGLCDFESKDQNKSEDL